MLVFLVTVIVMNGQEFTREEKMFDVDSCVREVGERIHSMLKAHSDLTSIKVGCEVKNGDPV